MVTLSQVDQAIQGLSAYGPYAFGMVSLLLLWYAIVKPTIERNAIDVKSLQVIADTMKEAAMLLKQSIAQLSECADKLADAEKQQAANGGGS